MSNIISIGAPRRPNLAQRQSLLLESFARHRRRADDVYWLKENAEILNVLATGGATLGPQALTIYEAFYRSIEERLRFFPQYYRFLLSICLDLEDLGLPGGKGEALCHWAQRSKLSASELSDLQRAEAERLFARRGAAVRDRALEDRLRAFICHSETFALPNKKAAYELTHIVFYLSNYGSQCPGLSKSAITSLEFAALMAFLDQDIDLLSEVCVALRFAGVVPSEVWEDWLTQALGEFVLSAAPDGAVNDCYHQYLVTSWWAGISGGQGILAHRCAVVWKSRDMPPAKARSARFPNCFTTSGRPEAETGVRCAFCSKTSWRKNSILFCAARHDRRHSSILFSKGFRGRR